MDRPHLGPPHRHDGRGRCRPGQTNSPSRSSRGPGRDTFNVETRVRFPYETPDPDCGCSSMGEQPAFNRQARVRSPAPAPVHPIFNDEIRWGVVEWPQTTGFDPVHAGSNPAAPSNHVPPLLQLARTREFRQASCPPGGIGRRAALRSLCRKACPFESGGGHHRLRQPQRLVIDFFGANAGRTPWFNKFDSCRRETGVVLPSLVAPSSPACLSAGFFLSCADLRDDQAGEITRQARHRRRADRPKACRRRIR